MNRLLLAAGGGDPNPLDHVVPWEWVKIGDGLFGFTLMSNQIFMMIVAAAIVLFVIPAALRKRQGNDPIGRFIPKGVGNAIEAMCEMLRKHVVEPSFGPYTDRYVHYFWSVFFFVLTCNLLGLIPIADWTKPISYKLFGNGHLFGGTATGNIGMTAVLAVCTLVLIVYNGLKLHGTHYISHFFMGPFPINILIGVLEIVGLLFKTFALAVRLFANMVAGHVLLAVLLMLIPLAAKGIGNLGALTVVSPLVIIGSVAINFLELFVAFLQAFIFTFLSAMFVGQAVNMHHEPDEHHEDATQEIVTPRSGLRTDEPHDAPAAAH